MSSRGTISTLLLMFAAICTGTSCSKPNSYDWTPGIADSADMSIALPSALMSYRDAHGAWPPTLDTFREFCGSRQERVDFKRYRSLQWTPRSDGKLDVHGTFQSGADFNLLMDPDEWREKLRQSNQHAPATRD